ncbi:hypothetical protein FKM82_018528 [Ascaphus truei]
MINRFTRRGVDIVLFIYFGLSPFWCNALFRGQSIEIQWIPTSLHITVGSSAVLERAPAKIIERTFNPSLSGDHLWVQRLIN